MNETRTSGERALPYWGAIGWVALAVALLTAGTSLLARLEPGSSTDLVSVGLLHAAVLSGVTVIVLLVHAPARASREALALRPTHPALAVFGLALGLSLKLPAEQLGGLVEARWPTPPEELAARAALFEGQTVAQGVALVVLVGCVGPLVEEVFFRGAIFGALRRNEGVVGAVVASSVLFVLAHGTDWRSLLPLAVLAAGLGYLRAASGSLVPCVALHVGFNAATAIALATGASSVTRPLTFGAGVTLLSWVATGGLLFAVQYVATTSDEAEDARVEDDDQ